MYKIYYIYLISTHGRISQRKRAKITGSAFPKITGNLFKENIRKKKLCFNGFLTIGIFLEFSENSGILDFFGIRDSLFSEFQTPGFGIFLSLGIWITGIRDFFVITKFCEKIRNMLSMFFRKLQMMKICKKPKNLANFE